MAPPSQDNATSASDAAPVEAGSARFDRRGLLRATIWSSPVVLLTVAAPAMAASPSDLSARLTFNNLNVSGAAFSGSQPTALVTQLQIQNQYYAAFPDTSATLTSLTVQVSYPDNRVSGANPTAVSGANWTFTSASNAGNIRRLTFTYTGTLAPGSSTSTLVFQVALSNKNAGNVSVTAVTSATHATSATASASYSVP